jgi:glycosyltransferase involved in cell wall biosynthesis
MRILALSTWWPEPADNGSRMRIMHLLRTLGERHEVHLVAFSQGPTAQLRDDELRRICASVQAVARPGRPIGLADQLVSLTRPEPASVRATWSAAFATRVTQTALQVQPDVILAFQIDVAPYAQQVPGALRVLEELELNYIFGQPRVQHSLKGRLRAHLTALKHRQYVAWLLRDFAAVSVVSEHEAALVRNLAPRNLALAVLPNGADIVGCASYAYAPEPDTLIYPGALSYDANLDAMRYFLCAIFPLITRERPNTTLRITGKATAEQRAALPALPGVTFTGYVEDIRGLIARSCVEVVPLRQGGGTRLKILEALALGTPVVSTAKGAEGLEVRPGHDLLIADEPRAFAEATLRLLADPDLRARLSAAGRQTVAQRYDWRTIGQRLDDLLYTAVAQRNAAYVTPA